MESSDVLTLICQIEQQETMDLALLSEFIEMTSGKADFQSINAGDYLHQRLVEIGLAKN